MFRIQHEIPHDYRDERLVELEHQHTALRTQKDMPASAWPTITDRVNEIEKEIVALPATGCAGVLVKLRLARFWGDQYEWDGRADRLLVGAIDTVEKIRSLIR